MENDSLPVIHNWKYCPNFNGKSVVIGQIFNDNRFKNGKVIRTSTVLSIAVDVNVFSQIETKNTIYDLGKELTQE